MAAGMAGLLTAVWGGLARLPMAPTASPPVWFVFHGPLMVCGFLGTVISLERAVGLPGKWAYGAPLLTAAGTLHLVTGGPLGPGLAMLTAGSAIFAAVAARVLGLRRELFTVTMGLGAVAWLAANLLWLAGWPVPRLVPWWMAFLLLTIAGERLDLSRFQKPSSLATPSFLAALGLLAAGLLAGLPWPETGQRLLGAAFVAFALWHGRFDLARRTLGQPGLPRFMSLCLLAGFVWLAVAGALLLARVPLLPGANYDAALHAFFLGYVFSMIFAHAPVIFPAVVGRPVAYHPRFYLHAGLLQVSLAARVVAALAGWPEVRLWGGLLNGLAIVLFLIHTVTAIATARPASPGSTRR
jgi:hypothetical protein